MSKFYFTYGTDPAYPFRDGWTEIEAPDQNTAAELFQEIHPDRPGSEGILNCAFVYEEDSFKSTKMYQDSNFGGHCHERLVFDGYRNKRIAFHREALSPEGEFVIRCAGKKTDMSVTVEGYISPLNFAILIKGLVEIGQGNFGPIFPELVQSVLNGTKFRGAHINYTTVQTDGGLHADED